MSLPLKVLLVGILAVAFAQDSEEEKTIEYAGTFMVVAPGVVRPGRPYAVSLNILKPGQEYITRVEIRNSRNETIATKIEKDVKSGAPITVRIDNVPAESLIPGEQYHVYVKGEVVGGSVLHFEAQQSLRFDPKSLSIFVQTDKAVYKPGALVQYRAVVVKPDLKPYTGTVTIKISDPNQNVIKQWLDARLTKGVTTQELQLSEEPPLGDWQIKVETDNGVDFTKTFSVEKYVLPKFEVTLEPPPVPTVTEDMPVTVKAKYTYGKGVAGPVTVTAKYPWDYDDSKTPIQKTANLDKDGEAVIRFTNDELKRHDLVSEYGYNNIKLIATVTETLTGIDRNATTDIIVHKNDVKVEMTKTMETFKPGLAYKLILAVKRQDDSPMPETYPRKVELKITYSYPWDSERQTQQESKEDTQMVRLDADGTKIIELLPPQGTSNLNIYARYDKSGKDNFANSELYNSLYVDAGKSPSDSFLQLISMEQEVEAGKNIKFTLKSTEETKAVAMQVMSRGSVVLSETIQMNGETATIEFKTTSEMAPKSRLVVYAIRDDNKEILVDAIDFQVTGLFRNDVSVKLSKAKAEPGNKVKVTVSAEADSFVGLLAVDQSVLLLKSGNDITPEMVENDISQYDTTFGNGGGGPEPWIGRPEFGRRKRSIWYPWWGISGKDAYTIFENAGLVVLTDAWLYQEIPEPSYCGEYGRCLYYEDDMDYAEEAAEFDDGGDYEAEREAAPASAGMGGGGGVPPSAPRTRTNFVETWIWVNRRVSVCEWPPPPELITTAPAPLPPCMPGPPCGPDLSYHQDIYIPLPPKPVWHTRFPEIWLWKDIGSVVGYCGEYGDCYYEDDMEYDEEAFDGAAAGDYDEAEAEAAPASNAMEKGGAGGGAPPTAPRTRTNFVETWIWVNKRVRANGEAVYTATVPDTITSWITSAFAVHDEAGLGVAPDTAKLQVFRPFFIRLNLPYSVKRGEKLALQVLVFNYQSGSQTVTLTLDHDIKNSGFDFVEKSGQPLKGNKAKATKNYNVRTTKVPGNGGSTSVFFPIVPTKIGEIKLKVTALGNGASDAVERPLLVEPEGFRVDKNQPIIIDLSEDAKFDQSVSLDFPPDAVEGSQKAKVAMIGDIMGPVLSNIENLVQMPYGCGEQNMLGFVPNIVVMRYLKATDRLSSEIETKATKYMEAGYQREMTYRRSDSSFSAFGNSDPVGSTWLTAFVVRSFKQASPYVFIDMDKVAESLQFINNQQAENGEFKEKGEVHHKDMQGGASEGGVPMTAYVLVALLENNAKNPAAVKYIEDRLDSVKDESYSLAVATYALHLANSAKKNKAMELLEAKAKDENGLKYWSDQVGEEKDDRYYWSGPRPVDVETTSYALLSYVLRGQISEGLPIVRWLTTQRNAFGGYSSTQDTVMALQALGAYAEKAYSPTFDVTIDVTSGKNKKKFSLDTVNALVLQEYEIDELDKPINLKASGSGIVFAQVQSSYHLTTMRDDLPFYCDQTVIQKKSGSLMTTGMCCKYKKGGKSNMAVMEFEALSGYTISGDDLETLKLTPGLKRVELAKSDTKANIYFDGLSDSPLCLNVSSELAYQVADQKPAQVVLYDYYEPKDRIELAYSAKQTKSMLAACPECWDGVVESGPGQSGTRQLVAVGLLLLSLLLACC